MFGPQTTCHGRCCGFLIMRLLQNTAYSDSAPQIMVLAFMVLVCIVCGLPGNNHDTHGHFKGFISILEYDISSYSKRLIAKCISRSSQDSYTAINIGSNFCPISGFKKKI